MDDVKLFGFSISHLPSWLILVIGAGGIFLSFLVQGTAQEAIYTNYSFRESVFFTFVQFFGYWLFTSHYFFKIITKKVRLHSPLSLYFIISIALVFSMGLSNVSVERLSYPTAVLFKASKLIPVMIGGMIFLHKKYNVIEISAVIIIVLGLIGISYSDKIASNKFDIQGVIIAVISLCADAISSNLQDKALHHYNAPQNEVITIMYLIGWIILLITSLTMGQFQRGISMCIQYPKMVFYLLTFAFLGSIGVQFVYVLMKAFGPVVTVTVTSTRKAGTVLLSFLLYKNKKFTIYHFFSVTAVAVGIYLEYLGKTKHKKEGGEIPKALINVNEEKDIIV